MSVIVTGPPSPRHQRQFNKSWNSWMDIVYCGKILSTDSDALSGCGTKITRNGLLATVSGLKKQFNKFYMVESNKSKYVPKRGDVVVGRVVRVQKTCWKLDVNHRLSANFRLENMNLPGGALRRRHPEDELSMGESFNIGDLAVAELQQVGARGNVELHCRDRDHGKLGHGILVEVWPSLIKLEKQNLHELYGVKVIIARNGFLWISPGVSSAHVYGEEPGVGVVVPVEKRSRMVRIAACVRLLAKGHICIRAKTIVNAYKLSLEYHVKDLARPDIQNALISKLGQLLPEQAGHQAETF
ncbi:hypothetical protein ANCCEY_03720 [Ancylostoma ceylanicum]|uniref:RRP4 S1 domain-containing protein n=2 Tax=Ancylostoma ceylanicum TaxID=53326 RepID=A0A016VLJ5_9BILA|nr:hypothetical protein ANCCEY_03720 [Ancylostoma ceylanicum]EYC27897.1 hypothetical protein Y032_0008g241 [Ancylostoma ceylanicum]